MYMCKLLLFLFCYVSIILIWFTQLEIIYSDWVSVLMEAGFLSVYFSIYYFYFGLYNQQLFRLHQSYHSVIWIFFYKVCYFCLKNQYSDMRWESDTYYNIYYYDWNVLGSSSKDKKFIYRCIIIIFVYLQKLCMQS